MYKLILSFLLMSSLLFGGCAEIQKKRELLVEPEKPLYLRANPFNIEEYIDQGNTLNARACIAWLHRNSLASKGLIASDHTLNIFSALMTAIAGITMWNPVAVALLGAGEVALGGFNGVIQQDVLGAPSTYALQTKVLELLQSCSDNLLANAKNLKPSQAELGLDICWKTCSNDAAIDATNKSLSNTTLNVQPSGKLTVAPK